MVTVLSTLCTYTAHDGLPELTGAVPVEIPDELLPLAQALAGVVVVVVDPTAPDVAPPVPDPVPAAVPDPPAVAEPDPSTPTA